MPQEMRHILTQLALQLEWRQQLKALHQGGLLWLKVLDEER
jgi:hypothetical protein